MELPREEDEGGCGMNKELNYLIHQIEIYTEITKALGNENVSLSIETTDELIRTIQKLHEQNNRYREAMKKIRKLTETDAGTEEQMFIIADDILMDID